MNIKDIPCHIYPEHKMFITLALMILTVYNIFFLGINVLYQVIVAVITALIIDGLIIKWKSKNWYFPSGAVISSIIIAQLISANYITLIGVVILSLILKYLLRPKFRNIFNPAALSVVTATIIFPFIPFFDSIFSTWWASSKIITPILGWALVILIQRSNTALSFLIPYLILDSFKIGIINSLQSLLAGPIIYFAFFMVIEPVTTPTTNKGRITFGVGVAVLVFIFSFFPYMLSNSFFLFIPLLIMNLVMRLTPKNVLG